MTMIRRLLPVASVFVLLCLHVSAYGRDGNDKKIRVKEGVDKKIGAQARGKEGFVEVRSSIHVWLQSPNPKIPYGTKNEAAHTIREGLRFAETREAKLVLVHGQCEGSLQCEYHERIQVPCGLDLDGSADGSEWLPVIDGDERGSVVRAGPCESDIEEDRISIHHFVIRDGKADRAGRLLPVASVFVLLCLHVSAYGRDGNDKKIRVKEGVDKKIGAQARGKEGFVEVRSSIHVWLQSPNPKIPYGTKNEAAHTIREGLRFAETREAKLVLVHGQCEGSLQCEYHERIQVPCGLDLDGSADGSEWLPVIDGDERGSVVRAGPCESDIEEDRISIHHFVIRDGKADRGGGISIVDAPARIYANCIIGNRAEKEGGGVALTWTTNTFLPSYLFGNLIGDKGYYVGYNPDKRKSKRNKAVLFGGGLFVKGVYDPSEQTLGKAHVNAENNIFRTNKLLGEPGKYVGGGAIAIYRARVRSTRNLFDRNEASTGGSEDYGGAVLVYNFNENEEIGFDLLKNKWPKEAGQYFSHRNIYRDNRSGYSGGAWAGIGWTSLQFEEDLMENNVAAAHGGAGYTSINTEATVRKSLINGNGSGPYPDKGGGLYISCGSDLTLEEVPGEIDPEPLRPE